MSQPEHHFTLTLAGVDAAVVQLVGHEGLSQLFHFELVLASSDPDLSFDVVGQDALLSIHSERGEHRLVHGMIGRFAQSECGGDVTTYRASLVPQVSRLQHRSGCRIFQNATAPGIVQQVLEDAGLVQGDDFRLALQESYEEREYCVQYRETDWALVCRLLEDEGISFFFEHTKERHTMVLADSAPAYDPLAEPTVPFRTESGALEAEECVSRFELVQEIRAGKVTLRDHDLDHPALDLEQQAAGSSDAELELYEYPGAYTEPGVGSARAQRRLQEVQASSTLGQGQGTIARFACGRTFDLSGHPRDGLNDSYLLVHLEHEGRAASLGAGGPSDSDGGATYGNRFSCVPASVPYRPPRLAPRPMVRGAQTAVVTGPEGEEIHTDEQGRVRVRFHWDREDRGENSSCWLRVAQSWAGASWGAVVLPRVGQEVLVEFLDGDPDRPIVIGGVYHRTNVPPYALPDEKTKTTFMSRSTPGGEGFNELRFEDQADAEEIYLHAERDLTIEVLNDASRAVAHDQRTQVDNDEEHQVGHDRTVAVEGDQGVSVGGDRSLRVEGSDSTEVTGDRTARTGGDQTIAVAGNAALTVEGGTTEEVSGAVSETCEGKRAVEVGADHDLSVGGDRNTTVSGGSTENVELEKRVTVGKKIVLVCGSSTVTLEQSGAITVEGTSLEVSSSGQVKVESTGGQVDITATGEVNLSGSNVGIN